MELLVSMKKEAINMDPLFIQSARAMIEHARKTIISAGSSKFTSKVEPLLILMLAGTQHTN
jgi:hypothetical protein